MTIVNTNFGPLVDNIYIKDKYDVHTWILEKLETLKTTLSILEYDVEWQIYPFAGKLYYEITAIKNKNKKWRIMFVFERPLAWKGNKPINGELKWEIKNEYWSENSGFYMHQSRHTDIDEALEKFLEMVS